KEARSKKELFGDDIAYTVDNRVIASSFAVGDGEGAKEDTDRAQELSRMVFGNNSAAAAAIAANKVSDVFDVRVRGEDYLAVAAPMQGNSVQKSAGVLILRSTTQALKPVASAGTSVVLLGGLALLVALAASLLTARRFLGPLDQLETGVAEVINGNLDYAF